MPDILCQPPSLSSLADMAPRLRAADIQELSALSFDNDPLVLLTELWVNADYCQGFYALDDAQNDDAQNDDAQSENVLQARLVAVWAVRELHPGVFNLAFVATHDWQGYARAISRRIKTQVKPALLAAGMRRGLAFCLAEHKTAHRWMRWLGLMPEASVPGLGKDGQDFLMFGISIPKSHSFSQDFTMQRIENSRKRM